MPPTPRNPKKGPIIITSGPGRPAPIKKQPLPAYGPYKLPLTDTEKRIVIRKRTPKFVETSRGRIATGGGGVGFFTKGDKGKIMDRVRERAIDRQDTLSARAEKVRVAGEQRIATPDYSNLRKMISEKKKEDDDPGFLSGLADDLGLDDFYTDNVLPVVGRAFGEAFETAKETYGVGLVSPGVTIARAAAGAVGKEQEVDKAFDYAAELVKGGAAIAKTQGFDRVKPYVASVIDGAAALGKGGADAVGNVDDFLQTEVPVYDSAKTWADRNAVRPTKDAAVEVLSRVTNQPINRRIANADEFDRNFVYQANDITQRGQERESAAPQERRDVWVQMALGEYDDPAWEGYESPFTREQLERMSDYELANAAYGTHTNSIAALFEAAKNDFKKIGAMPAALGALSKQIENSKDSGDFRGLGNMAEFLVRQGLSNMVALSKANIYVMSGGQAGNYQDLVRALKAEPILTGLDVASTATIYGKAATFGLKSGGALTKAGALASRVPGAARAGEAIARGAEDIAYSGRLGAPLARGAEGPSGLIPRPAGAPLRAAAAVGRGLRRVADTERVEVFDPRRAGQRSIEDSVVLPDRVFRPSSSIFSKASSLVRKRLYEGDNPISGVIFRSGVKADARTVRALTSAVTDQLGSDKVVPVVSAFTKIYDESPDLLLRVMWDISGAQKLDLPEGVGGGTATVTPAMRAQEFRDVLAGKYWVKDAGGGSESAIRKSDTAPGPEWKRMVVNKEDAAPGENVFVMRPEEVGATEAQIILMDRLAEVPQSTIDRAAEVLNSPYAEVFGSRIGRRIGGKNAPEGSLADVLRGVEVGTEAEPGSVRLLSKMGIESDVRSATEGDDLRARVSKMASSRLNLSKSDTGGVRRRVPGMAAIARLQDETIARFLPLVGDKFRAVVEDIIGERLASHEDYLRASERNLAEAQQVADFGLPASEKRLADLEKELADVEAANQSALPEGSSLAVPLQPQEAADFAVSQIDDGLFGGIRNVDSNLPLPDSEAPLSLSAETVFGVKTGGPAGSNTGGPTGFWTGTDGVKRYVKLYKSDEQAFGEVVANELYRRLGIKVPESNIVGWVDDAGNKRLLVANTIIENSGFDLTKESATDVLRGIVADTWIANWDAVGTGLDNVVTTADGGIARIDQGGALLYRAQGEKKGGDALVKPDIADFINNNPDYRRVIETAGFDNAEDLSNFVYDQLRVIDELVNGDTESLVGLISSKILDGVDNDLKVASEINMISAVLEKRLSVLKKKFEESGAAYAARAKKTKSPEKSKAAVKQYINTDGTYAALNEWLRQDMPDDYKFAEYHLPSKGFFYGSLIDRAKQYVEALDEAVASAPPTTKPMVVYRGVSGNSQISLGGPGDSVVMKGFSSTDFKKDKAQGFSGEGVLFEIFVPPGSKGIVAHAAHWSPEEVKSYYVNGQNWGQTPGTYGEHEFILPRDTEFQIVEVIGQYPKVYRVVAITPGSTGYVGRAPLWDAPQNVQAARAQKISEAIADAKWEVSQRKRVAASVPAKKRLVELAQAEYDKVAEVQNDIDFMVESLMRDWLESSDNPTGALAHIPTIGSPLGAKKEIFARDALAGRGQPRDLRRIYTGQYALLGSMEDLERFSGALARNMRIPFVAHQAVMRLTNYLIRTNTFIHLSDDLETFEKQKVDIAAAGALYNNGNGPSDWVIIPVNDKTGLFDKETFKVLDLEGVEAVGTKGRSDTGVDDAELAVLLDEAIKDNAVIELDKLQPGTDVVIVNAEQIAALRSELADAAKQPGMLRRITRQWVRITLTTLPRTPIANVVGSSLLSALGGGLGGYPEAMRLVRSGDAPPELLNNGVGGMFDEGGSLVVPSQSNPFRYAQRYMNYMYYYNVMGEDLARMSVFAQAMKRGLKSKSAAKMIDEELAEARQLNDSFQTLLEAVARGKFSNGKELTPELIRIRDEALQKADDFLGGARGLTSRQRVITTAIPFWMWYKHIFKLYFYTLPFKYPGRSLTLNAMARLGAEESARNGFYDSFYEDAIKIGEEVRGQNIYSRGLTTNIFPFNFGGALEYDEGAPGVQFALSNIAPTLTIPARLAGIGIPGAPIIGAGGERLKPGDVFAPGYAEAAVAEAEKLFAPLGLVQSTIAPRSSLAFDAYRFATGQPLPEAQQRGEGEQYAVTPRGIGGLGLSRSVLDAFTRSFGVNIVRTPVRGPVAERRITDEQARLEEEARKRYRESLGLDY